MYRSATLGNYGSNGTDIDHLGHVDENETLHELRNALAEDE